MQKVRLTGVKQGGRNAGTVYKVDRVTDADVIIPDEKAPSYFDFTEVVAPDAPAANGVRLYAEDNGAGKTRIVAKFATGAAIVIATQA